MVNNKDYFKQVLFHIKKIKPLSNIYIINFDIEW